MATVSAEILAGADAIAREHVAQVAMTLENFAVLTARVTELESVLAMAAWLLNSPHGGSLTRHFMEPRVRGY